MISADHQAAVTAKVQETFAAFPAIGLVPNYTENDPLVFKVLVQHPAEEAEYVTALYELFNVAPEATLIGRRGLELVAA